GPNALVALREQVERANADTILVIHDDHFVNFDFWCYPPFALLVGQEAKGSGVIDPDTIEQITGATYRKYEGKDAYQSAPSGIPQHMANWDERKPYVYKVNTDLSVRLLKGLLEREFDVPFTSDGTMDGEEVLTTTSSIPRLTRE